MTNKNEIKSLAKTEVRNSLAEILTSLDAVPIAENSFAVPVVIEGLELYVTVELVAKNWYSTKASEAFNIDSEVETYKITKAEKEAKAIAAAKIKAEKLKKEKKIEITT